MTPSAAKNAIRRALRDLVDPQLSDYQKDCVWEYFESSCAYCGTGLARADRKGHLDHLLSSSLGGLNHMANRVLACGACNGDEKRDESWESFLKRKNPNGAIYAERLERIRRWMTLHAVALPRVPPEWMDVEIAKVITEFDKACAAIRSAARAAT